MTPPRPPSRDYVAIYPDAPRTRRGPLLVGQDAQRPRRPRRRRAAPTSAPSAAGRRPGWAPDAVVELARSLVALKKPTDACQTLAEFGRRYPKAPAAVAAAARPPPAPRRSARPRGRRPGDRPRPPASGADSTDAADRRGASRAAATPLALTLIADAWARALRPRAPDPHRRPRPAGRRARPGPSACARSPQRAGPAVPRPGLGGRQARERPARRRPPGPPSACWPTPPARPARG